MINLRINVDIKLQRSELPLDYAPAFVSLIKAVTSEYAQHLFEKLYVQKSHSEKNFCFAVRLNSPDFHKNKIILGDENIHMVIDIADLSDGIDLYNALVMYKGKSYPFPDGNMISIENLSIKNHKSISSDKIFIKMLSPLIIRINETDNNYYISCNDEQFNKYFSMSVSLMLKRLYDIDVSAGSIQIFNVKAKKTVVNTFRNKITANVGTYIIKADAEILNIISQTGIGSRRSQGFGCFDIIAEVK